MTAKTGRPKGRPPSPETLMLRQVAQAMQTQLTQPTSTTKTRVKNRYDAGGQGRRLAGWNPPKTSPNTAIAQLERIRERARDSSRNDWTAASGVQKWTTTLVGIGITPRWKRIKSKTKKAAVTDLWTRFGRRADADCVLDIYAMQSMVVRTWFDGGECFARRRNRFPDAGYPVPMQIQLLESDMVPMLDATVRQGLPIGHEIKSGIEFDKRGQRVAYWVYKSHPGDAFQNYNGEELVRVAASEMCHIFEPKRPGQIRGVSESAPILAKLRNVGDYEDATLERQKIANLFVGFISRKLPEYGDLDVDPLTGDPLETEVAPPPLAGLQPGLMQTLADGEEVNFSNPPEAGTTYSDYMRTSHIGTSAGMGMPYELLTGDIKDISDRALRIVINEFRRLAEQRQWQIVIPMFCQRVVEWFAEAALLMGEISQRDLLDVSNPEHAPHGWPDIHPTQDIEGQIAAVGAGFRSQSSVISARGDDPDAVAEEQAEDDKRMQTLKIGPYSAAAKLAAAPAPAASGKTTDNEETPPEPGAQE